MLNNPFSFLCTCQDDVPPRYDDPGVRHSRARLSYDIGGGNASQYGDAYGDRFVVINL